MSLGTDDAARTKFFEDVADKLEERIGRIPYDYETLTAREKDAMNRKLQYAEMQDRQQYAQEYEFAAQQKFAKEQEQQTNVETSSKRGLLGSGIQQKESSRLALARKLTQEDPFYRQAANEREERNFLTAQEQTLSDQRLQDIKIQARRGALNIQYGYDKGSEAAQREKDKAIAAAQRAGRSSLLGIEGTLGGLAYNDYLNG